MPRGTASGSPSCEHLWYVCVCVCVCVFVRGSYCYVTLRHLRARSLSLLHIALRCSLCVHSTLNHLKRHSVSKAKP